MKLTKSSQPSWLFKILEAEYEKASALFCMQWAVEDEDYIYAMFHQLDYLYHSDTVSKLYWSMTPTQFDKYWGFKDKARGLSNSGSKM